MREEEVVVMVVVGGHPFFLFGWYVVGMSTLLTWLCDRDIQVLNRYEDR